MNHMFEGPSAILIYTPILHLADFKVLHRLRLSEGIMIYKGLSGHPIHAAGTHHPATNAKVNFVLGIFPVSAHH